ncbi:hypothetical protein ACNHE5_08465 [Pandoraea pnomenusa]|uniref:hypothetical protein n=1 Tax=Pandoraea pnomenusa TaxID=93220 RepID=UPI003CF08C71
MADSYKGVSYVVEVRPNGKGGYQWYLNTWGLTRNGDAPTEKGARNIAEQMARDHIDLQAKG